MKVRLYYDGCRYDRKDECQIEREINDTLIELSRVPNVGEHITLFLGDYWFEGKVTAVYTYYCEKNNPHRYQYTWGEGYSIFVGEIEVYQKYESEEDEA